ncbi:hypothetical protein V8G54_010514 [Vigna mungo]|uniref:Uncharacterized protein n=1 Tax=Vigna mungo TaxID=3915 RepID=A0AAQ3NZ02_VIGMU
MVHGLPRHILMLRGCLLPTNQPRRVPNRGGPWRHINQNHRAGTNLCTFPNLNISQNCSTSANKHPIPNLGMPVTTNLASPAQCNMVQNGYIVPNHRCLPHHHPSGMIKQNPLPNPRRRVNIHRKHISNPRVQCQCQRPPRLPP